jgi:Domain of Unknown Function (DUF928)
MRQLLKSTFGISLVFVFFVTSTENQFPVTMQSAYALSAKNLKRKSPGLPRVPKTPPIKGARVAGSTLGVCRGTPLFLTALVPEYADGQIFAQTTLENPTFLFYLPYTSSDKYVVKFVLQDEEGNEVHSQFVRSPKNPGIISVTIPPKLEVNKLYQWYFQVNCETPPRTVSGVIQRVALNKDVMRKINAATPEERIGIYSENNIWYDALSILMSLRLNRPQDAGLKNDWNEFLNSVQLQNITTEPIVK